MRGRLISACAMGHNVLKIRPPLVLTADQAGLVIQALDGAIRADLGTLRIIHGKGTGALRERVNALLKTDARVKSFRLGAWNEGGAGVTVAELA